MGNNRLIYADLNKNDKIDAGEIIEENNYYPFGLKHQGYNELASSEPSGYKYKFGGKELQDELGLNIYDFEARGYMPDLGRFFNHDPLSETTLDPFGYTYNNPVNMVDPTGMMAIDNDDWIDIDKKTGGLTITKKEGDDIVRLVHEDKIINSYTYGENGTFLKETQISINDVYYERQGYKIDFSDYSKAKAFYHLATKSDVEFSLVDIFYGRDMTGITTVITNHDSYRVQGSNYAYDILRNNKDAYLLEASHSHPGYYNADNFYPAAPSGFNYKTLEKENYSGDRTNYQKGRAEFGNRIPKYFEVYVPGNTNIQVKYNDKKAIRKFK